MKSIGYNAVSIALILLAGFLAYNNIQGWGWCVIGGLLTYVNPKSNNDDE